MLISLYFLYSLPLVFLFSYFNSRWPKLSVDITITVRGSWSLPFDPLSLTFELSPLILCCCPSSSWLPSHDHIPWVYLRIHKGYLFLKVLPNIFHLFEMVLLVHLAFWVLYLYFASPRPLPNYAYSSLQRSNDESQGKGAFKEVHTTTMLEP